MIELADEHIPPAHPTREDGLDEWAEAALCYQGGKHYLVEYLAKHKKERQDSYQERLARAIHPNYLASVIDTYAGHLYRQPPVRDYPSNLEPLLENADLIGNKLDVFMRDVAAHAQIFPAAAVLVDRWEPDAAPKTKAQERESGRRPYFKLLNPWDIWDWSVDATGDYNWILLREDRQVERRPFEENNGPGSQWRLWTRDAWALYVYPDGQDTPQLIDQGENPTGRVPVELLRFGAANDQGHVGTAPARDLVRMNRRITNLYSLLDEQIWQYVFSILVVGARTYDTLKKANWSVSGAIGLADGDEVAPFYLSPDVEQIRVIQEQINETVQAIRVLSGLGRQNEKGAAQPSGLAMRLMSVDKIATLKDRAMLLEDFEANLFALAAAWMDQGDVEITPPNYAKEFLEADLATMLEDVIKFESLRIGGAAREKNLELAIRAYFTDRIPPAELDAILADFETNPPPADTPAAAAAGQAARGAMTNPFSQVG